jgi:hypothetical protein
LQSGLDAKRARREERDLKQREARKQKDKALDKIRPKSVREGERANARSSKDKVKDFCLRGFDPAFDETQLQSGLSEAVPAIAGVAAGVGLTVAAYKLYSTLNKVDTVLDGVNDLLDRLRAFGRELRNHLGDALWTVPLVLVVYYFVSSSKTMSQPVFLALTTALSTIVGAKMWAVVSDFFRVREPSLQSGFSGLNLSGFYSVVPKLLTTTFLFSVFKHGMNAYTAVELNRRLASATRVNDGWESFLRWLITALETSINFVREWFGQDRMKMFIDNHEPMRKWAQEVTRLVGISDKGGTYTPERSASGGQPSREKFKRLMARGQ